MKTSVHLCVGQKSVPEGGAALEDVAIVVNPDADNVAVSKTGLAAGTCLSFQGGIITLRDNILKGQRFAIKDIDVGEYVIQYGYPFGRSTSIHQGALIHNGNIVNVIPDLAADLPPTVPETVYQERSIKKSFLGYRRANGMVGTRNYYLVVPSSLCASQVAQQIAQHASATFDLGSLANVDEVVAIPHTEGCGCASGPQIQRFLRVLKNTVTHPNVGGVLIVDLGCEQTNYQLLHAYLEEEAPLAGVPRDWLTIQQEGGTRRTVARALEIIGTRLDMVNRAIRTRTPLKHLVVGAECGASDAFSGITANPVIGNVVDKVVAGQGSAIFSEFPEMVGAENALCRRMRNEGVVAKFLQAMTWYREMARRLEVNMDDNLVPENRSGGLLNPCIKSLGAIAKGGTTVIEDVLRYGERVTQRGLHIMQGPGNDLESVTGLTASGATVICFSTGRGTITGSALAPVIKVSSTTEMFQRLPEDMDFDAGPLLAVNGRRLQDDLGEELLELVLAVASGQRTWSEINGQRQFQVWTAGKLSL